MRRKPSGQNNNYGSNRNNNRPRYTQIGGEGGGHRSGGGNHGGNRPRKNYSAMREKYLNQARDAMASGDRVLAENYLQHADHCYRMMMEEGYRPNNQQQASEQQAGEQQQPSMQEEIIPENTSALPAFLTATHEPSAHAEPVVQNWEERDA